MIKKKHFSRENTQTVSSFFPYPPQVNRTEREMAVPPQKVNLNTATFSASVCVWREFSHVLFLLQHVSRGIKEEREAEEPKTIPLKVYGKGINTFAVVSFLPLSPQPFLMSLQYPVDVACV